MKNVIFDLGGVVVDWNPQQVLNDYPGDRELPVSLFKRGFFEKHWIEFDRGTILQDGLVSEMADFTGHPYDACWDFVEFIKHSLVDVPKTLELIQRLSTEGYRLFCLSNMSVEFYDYLKVREVFSYFDGQIISAQEHLVKPEEAIYRLILDRYELKPEESLFIDDLEPNIKAAATLGIHTVHFADREKGYGEIDEKLKMRE